MMVKISSNLSFLLYISKLQGFVISNECERDDKIAIYHMP